jgi:hypothetical protein
MRAATLQGMPSARFTLLAAGLIAVGCAATFGLFYLKATEPELPVLAVPPAPAPASAAAPASALASQDADRDASAASGRARDAPIATGSSASTGSAFARDPWPEATQLMSTCIFARWTPQAEPACAATKPWCDPDRWTPEVKARLTTPEAVDALARSCHTPVDVEREWLRRLRNVSPTMAAYYARASASRVVIPDGGGGAGVRAAPAGVGPNCSDALLTCLMADHLHADPGPDFADACMERRIPRCSPSVLSSSAGELCCPDACVEAYRRARASDASVDDAMTAFLFSGCDPRPSQLDWSKAH